MKILLENWVYNSGSTGYIVRDLSNEYQRRGYVVYVATGISFGQTDENIFIFSNDRQKRLFGRLTKFLGRPRFKGSTLSAIKFISYVKKVKPDIVHIHLLNCHVINTFYVLKWLGKHNIKTVVTHHSELFYTGSCGHAYDCLQFANNQCVKCNSVQESSACKYFGNTHKNWQLMKEAFDSFKSENLYFTAVSPWVKSRSQLSPIVNKFRCEVVQNGVDISIFNRKENYSISNNIPKDYLLYVSAYFHPNKKEDIKGGYYLSRLAETLPNTKFIVVTSNAGDCSNLPDNVYVWGKAKNQDELAGLYANAKLTVLTSRKETFSMICAESLCCGTPVVGFSAGGPESIAIKEYSEFVEQANIAGLKDAIDKFLSINFDRSRIAQEAQQIYSKKNMADGYVAVYKELLNS